MKSMAHSKTILITGPTAASGWKFARQLLTRGDRVLATCRDPKKAEELKKPDQSPSRSVV